jgi:hypothetical protein
MSSPAITPSSSRGERKKEGGLERLLIVVGALLIFIVLFAHGSVSWYEEVAGKSSLPAMPQVPGGEGGVVSVTWVDKGEITSGGRVRFWIQVENHTKSVVNKLQLFAFTTPGFKEVGPCWTQHLPSCRPGSVEGKPTQQLPGTLKPGESSILYADLSPDTWYGYHGASGVLSWQDDSAGTWERAVVLPAVQIASPRGRLLASIGRSLDLLKDLALPLVLVVFGSYLQNQAKKREQEQADQDQRRAQDKAAQDQRLADEKASRDRQLADEKAERDKQLAQEKAERDREQAQVRETWAMMLPKLQRYAERHYMPVYSSIEAFADLAEEPTKSREAFFELLRLIRRMRHLATSVGGLFFKDRQGEVLAAKTWRLFLDQARDEKVLGREDLERTLTVIATDENYAQFLDKLAGRNPGVPSSLDEAGKPLQDLEGKFIRWKKTVSFPQDVALLKLFGGILSYEMNRPYLFWYSEPVKFPVDKFEAALSLLSSGREELKDELRTYLKSLKGETTTTKT